MSTSFKGLLATGAAVAVMGLAQDASAETKALHIVPFEGNPTCADIVNNPDVLELKVDQPPAGLSEHSSNGLMVELELTDGRTRAAWTAIAGGPVNSVIVKTGSGGKIYVFPNEGVLSDKDEVGTLNNRGILQEISHMSWCHGIDEPEFAFAECSIDEGTVPEGHVLFDFDRNEVNFNLAVCTPPDEPVVFCDRSVDAPDGTACVPAGTVLKVLPIVIEALCTVTPEGEVEGCSTFCTVDLNGKTRCFK